MLKKHPKIKKDDKVIITTGKDKGKIGVVVKVNKQKNKIVVENSNIIKRHTKPNMQNAQGGIVEKESPLHISNVMIVCNKCAEPTRVAHKTEDGTKIRICRKCKEPIDNK